MKLIIDIPEERLDSIKHFGIKQNEVSMLESAVLHSTSLDDVKAEIEKQIKRDFVFSETETLKVPCHYGIANGLQNAIRFLDNIGGGLTHDK